MHTDYNSQANSWVNYYKELATPHDDNTFNDDYQHHLETVYLLEALTTDGITLEPVSVKHLKKQKAADIFGITAEHVKHHLWNRGCKLQVS